VDKRTLAKSELADGGGGRMPPPIDDDATKKGGRGGVCGGFQSPGEIIRREIFTIDQDFNLAVKAVDHPEPTHDWLTFGPSTAQTVSSADTPA
jgi:hypothetical protein